MRYTSSVRQKGMTTLVITLVLLLCLSIMVLAVAKSTLTEQRISANEYDSAQALEASRAGLQFGIVYLMANIATIVKDANNDGYIDAYSNSSTSNVALNDGAQYTINYSNPVSNNFSLVKVSCTGTSANGSVTRTVSELVAFYNSLLPHAGNEAMVIKKIANISGTVTTTNTATNGTLYTGSTINKSGATTFTTGLGTTTDIASSVANVISNQSALGNATTTAFFQNFFGASQASVKAQANIIYNSGADFASTLNGTTGKVIWFNSNANLSSSATLGSAAAPVIVIVNGNMNISGTLTIYGFVLATGDWNISGNVTVNGISAVGNNFNASGNIVLNYSSSVLNNLSQFSQKYAPVAGSWKDF